MQRLSAIAFAEQAVDFINEHQLLLSMCFSEEPSDVLLTVPDILTEYIRAFDVHQLKAVGFS